jgi:hypothetical protein
MLPPAPQAQSKGFKTQNIKYLSLQSNYALDFLNGLLLMTKERNFQQY